MHRLIHAEWTKLAQRPLIWGLLAIFLSSMILFLTLEFLIVALDAGTFSGGQTRIQLLDETMIEQFQLRSNFPGIFGAVLGQINGLGGICAIILAAMAVGSEYSWGTIRVQLARQPRRWHYLASKLLVICGLLLLGMIIALLVGSLLAAGYGSMLGTQNSLTGVDLLLLPIGVLRSLYIILPYLLATVAVSIVGRSVFVGVTGGLLFLGLDAGASSFGLLANLNIPLITFLSNLPLQQNINTLMTINSHQYGLNPSIVLEVNQATLPSPLQATLTIAVYCALFLGVSYYSLQRSDIGGPT